MREAPGSGGSEVHRGPTTLIAMGLNVKKIRTWDCRRPADTCAKWCCARLNAVHFNAMMCAPTSTGERGFSEALDRAARRMGWLCDRVVKDGALRFADLSAR